METNQSIFAQIDAFNAAHTNVMLSYGGDGTVLRSAAATNYRKAIIPFRNYGLCDAHKNRLLDFLNGTTAQKELKATRCQLIEFQAGNAELSGRGLAEISFKNNDITSALRFNVYVNGNIYMKNVCADGCCVSTAFGSTGYFKSISRSIFNCNALGVAFIAPSQGINNLILDGTSRVRFEFIRAADITISNDCKINKIQVSPGYVIGIGLVSDAVLCFGLDVFHCQDCRASRHAAIENGIEIEDKYAV